MTDGDGSSARNFRSAYYEKLGFCGNDEKNYLDILIEASPFDDEKLNELCDRPELDRKCVEAWKVLLGVECGRKNPFDDHANVRRVRSEHFQLLKHHLEVLLKHNLLIKSRLAASKTCSQNDNKQQRPTTTITTTASRPSGEDNDYGMAFKAQDHQSSPQYHQNQNHNQNHHNLSHEEQHQHHREHHENENKLRERADCAKLITMMYLLETGGLNTLDIEGQLGSQECRKLLSTATFFVNVANDLQEAFFLLRNFTNHIKSKTTP